MRASNYARAVLSNENEVTKVQGYGYSDASLPPVDVRRARKETAKMIPSDCHSGGF